MSEIISKKEINSPLIGEILQRVSAERLEIKEVIALFLAFYYQYTRHRYSIVSKFLIDSKDGDLIEGLLETLDSVDNFIKENPDYIDNTVKKLKYNPKDINRIEFDKAIGKLKDHIELEQYRYQNAVNQSLEQVKNIEATITRITTNFESNTRELETKMNAGFITILGIFAAIIIAFFGGVQAINSIFTLAGKVSLWEVIFLSLFAALVIFNIIFMFLYFLTKFTDKNLCCRRSKNTNGNMMSILIYDYTFITAVNIIMGISLYIAGFKLLLWKWIPAGIILVLLILYILYLKLKKNPNPDSPDSTVRTPRGES